MDNFWEDNIYSKNKQINKYPFDKIVSYIFQNYGQINYEKRSEIKILEIGCGTGPNIIFLSENGFDTYGIDISQTAIKIANSQLKQKNLKSNLEVGSFTNLPFPDNYFDLVIDSLSMTHCPHLINDTLINVNRVMKNDGKFFSIMFNTEHDGYKYALKENKKNNYVVSSPSGYLKNAGGATYFINDDLTIIKNHFDVLSYTKCKYETLSIDNLKTTHGETILVLIKKK